jgi:hypothetical protein
MNRWQLALQQLDPPERKVSRKYNYKGSRLPVEEGRKCVICGKPFDALVAHATLCGNDECEAENRRRTRKSRSKK